MFDPVETPAQAHANRQDAFNRVWNHFITNGAPASYDTKAMECRYNGPNGAMCAFSLLLTEDERKKALEGTACYVLINRWELTRFMLDGRDDEFYWVLQQTHDASARKYHKSFATSFREDLKAALQEVADRFGLEIPQ